MLSRRRLVLCPITLSWVTSHSLLIPQFWYLWIMLLIPTRQVCTHFVLQWIHDHQVLLFSLPNAHTHVVPQSPFCLSLSQIPVNLRFVALSTFNVWLIIAVVVSRWTTQETLASVRSCKFFVVRYCAGSCLSTWCSFSIHNPPPLKTPKRKSFQFIYSAETVYLIKLYNLLVNDTIYCNQWYYVT